jgi:hypothetical protein
MRPQLSTLSEFFSQRRLYMFDGLLRAIPSILTIEADSSRNCLAVPQIAARGGVYQHHLRRSLFK